MLLLADVIVKLIQILWLNRLICFDLHSQFLLTYTFYLKLFLFNVFLRKSWYKHSKVTTLYSIHCEYQIKMYVLLSETRFCKKILKQTFYPFENSWIKIIPKKVEKTHHFFIMQTLI